MPNGLYLQDFGQILYEVFGTPPYQVGSTLTRYVWRDVDVRIILEDEIYKERGYGSPENPHDNAKWVGLVKAFSLLGKEMTGLPIDFQIQQQSYANKKFKGPRSALFIRRINQ